MEDLFIKIIVHKRDGDNSNITISYWLVTVAGKPDLTWKNLLNLLIVKIKI